MGKPGEQPLIRDITGSFRARGTPLARDFSDRISNAFWKKGRVPRTSLEITKEASVDNSHF